MRDYIQKSLELGIIRESSSPYTSPIVLARKKDGKLQLCVDYRHLNAKTHKDPEKVRAVSEWPRPETLRDLRGFFGLSGVYRRFLKGYAEVPGPLQRLLQGQGGEKKGKKVKRGTNPKGDKSIRDKWDSSCEAAFVTLKQMLTDAQVLGFPDFYLSSLCSRTKAHLVTYKPQ